MIILHLKDIMTQEVISVDPNTSIEQAAQLMQKHNIGSIPVCDQTGIKGIVTDRDIVVRNVANGTDPKSSKVSDVMTAQITMGTPWMEISEASQLMSNNQIRRLPVIDNNQLVGVVALGDLAVNPRTDTEASDALSDISTPAHPYGV